MSLYEIGSLAVDIVGKRLVQDVSLTVEGIGRGSGRGRVAVVGGARPED